MAYYDWFCTTFISSDWRTWNTVIDAERGLFISWPLSVFITVHLTACFILWNLLSHWLVIRASRAWWFAEGFAAGAHAKAIRLAEIKFSKDPGSEEGCILWQWDESLEDEARARYDALCGILGAECDTKRREG